jgi:hypothetical protein
MTCSWAWAEAALPIDSVALQQAAARNSAHPAACCSLTAARRPRPRSYDLPIFGLDVVMAGGRVTLAVVDCCPLRRDLRLPAHYLEVWVAMP